MTKIKKKKMEEGMKEFGLNINKRKNKSYGKLITGQHDNHDQEKEK